MTGNNTNTFFDSCDGSTEEKKINATINNIEGTIIYQNGNYIFTRKEQGESENIEEGTEIRIETQQGYNECFPIIWIGNNNNSFKEDPTKLVELYKDFLTSIGDLDDYIVIIPIYYEGDKEYTDEDYEIIKEKMMETFNDRCIDLKEEQWSIDSGYEKLAEIIKNKINALGFEIDSNNEENPNAGNVTFDGVLQVGDEITLEYIPLGNKLEPSPGTLMWLIQNEDTDLKNAALQFFSIDGFGNLIVANWSRTTTTIESNEDGIENIPNPGRIEYTLSTVKINYKTLISEYTMPFDYLWAFLVMGEDTEFVNNLTQLTLNSEINITLYDELTIVENDVRESHTEETKTRVEEDITEEYINKDRRTNHFIRGTETDYKIEDKYNNSNIVTETNKVRYRLTKADVWCLKYEVTGVNQVAYNGADGVDTSLPNIQEENFQRTTTTIPDEDWQEIGTDGPTSSSEPITKTISPYDEGEHIMDIGTKYVTTVKTYYKRLTNQQTITTIITSGYNYTEGVVNTEEKTDRTATPDEIATKTFNEPNFVRYYLYSQRARYKINGVYNWLFQILEKNRTTVGMVDITKYMIYKATEKDFGITSFDFSIYNDDDFKDAIEYNPGVSEGENGAMGDIYIEDDSINLGEAQVIGEGQFVPANNLNGGYYGYYTSSFGVTYKLYYQNYNLSTGTVDFGKSSNRNDWGSGSGGLCGVTAYATMMSGFGGSETPGTLYKSYGYGTPPGFKTISYRDVETYLRAGYPVRIGKNVKQKTGLPGGNDHFVVVLDIFSDNTIFVAETYYSSSGLKYTRKPLSSISGMSQYKAYTR